MIVRSSLDYQAYSLLFPARRVATNAATTPKLTMTIISVASALMSGVTTARSMGVSHFVDVGIRELAKNGDIDGPELLAAGYHVRPSPAQS